MYSRSAFNWKPLKYSVSEPFLRLFLYSHSCMSWPVSSRVRRIPSVKVMCGFGRGIIGLMTGGHSSDYICSNSTIKNAQHDFWFKNYSSRLLVKQCSIFPVMVPFEKIELVSYCEAL